MEAISTSVPSITVPQLHPKPHHHQPPLLHHHLKPPLLHHLHHHISTSTSTTVAGKPPTSISTKPPPSSHRNLTPHHLRSTPPRHQTHRSPATGYAAALVDAALCSGSIHAVHRDVKRLLKWLQNNEMLKGVMDDSTVDEGVKGRVVREVAEKGGLRRQVVALVKMLVAKGNSGMVAPVMEEFQRIYWELNNKGFPVVA